MLAAEEKYESSIKSSDAANASDVKTTPKVSTKILADGTYASEFNNTEETSGNARQLPNIKSKKGIINTISQHVLYYLELFLEGKFECSGVLADSLTKLMIRLKQSKTIDSSQYLALRTRVLLMLTSVLRLGGSRFVAQPIDRDSAERIALCIQILVDENGQVGDLEQALTVDSEAAFNSIQLKGKQQRASVDDVEIDSPIDFKLLSVGTRSKAAILTTESAINLVLNESTVQKQLTSTASSLNRVVQLTGFSDAIYAETYVQMAGKEVLLDLLLVNQTEETLQNVSIDLVCAGDLKLIEKPAQLTLPPYAFSSCKAIFKVTATNHGQIFGCISYLSGPTGQDSETVVLSEIKIDVLEYVKAAAIEEPAFRDVWVLLEWENKISIKVNGAGGGLKAFLGELMRRGHLTCITPNVFITDDNDPSAPTFLACNLYAKSIFGTSSRDPNYHTNPFVDEEILANLSLEISNKSKLITGHLRLRSKTQGLAVAYGDKLNSVIQKMTI